MCALWSAALKRIAQLSVGSLFQAHGEKDIATDFWITRIRIVPQNCSYSTPPKPFTAEFN